MADSDSTAATSGACRRVPTHSDFPATARGRLPSSPGASPPPPTRLRPPRTTTTTMTTTRALRRRCRRTAARSRWRRCSAWAGPCCAGCGTAWATCRSRPWRRRRAQPSLSLFLSLFLSLSLGELSLSFSLPFPQSPSLSLPLSLSDTGLGRRGAGPAVPALLRAGGPPAPAAVGRRGGAGGVAPGGGRRFPCQLLVSDISTASRVPYHNNFRRWRQVVDDVRRRAGERGRQSLTGDWRLAAPAPLRHEVAAAIEVCCRPSAYRYDWDGWGFSCLIASNTR